MEVPLLSEPTDAVTEYPACVFLGHMANAHSFGNRICSGTYLIAHPERAMQERAEGPDVYLTTALANKHMP